MKTMTTETTTKKLSVTPAMDAALAALVKGTKVRGDMLARLASRGLVKLERETRLSGAGGMPSISYVVVGGTLTRAGAARLAEVGGAK